MQRADERVLVDRLMWLAAVSPNAQVRAIASLKLESARQPRAGRGRHAGGQRPGRKPERAHRTLLAADIKRFLERPMNDAMSARFMPPSPRRRARRSATSGMDFLSRPAVRLG